MGIFKALKGDHPGGTGTSLPPRRPSESTMSTEDSTHQPQYQPPPGPPPRRSEYSPPPGPPPGRQEHAESLPNPLREPPPYHDWTDVPDNSLLPPPPSIGHEKGSAGNADSADADRAHDWCKANPLAYPHQPTPAHLSAVEDGDVRLMKPREYKGELLMPRIGSWEGYTRAGSKDACLLTSSPLYFAMADSPTRTRHAKTIYFEVEVKSLGHGSRNDECAIAIGYCAMPYPTWRMPGWERASLAIHSDDGRRYVNDTWGGKDFTSPICSGDTVGLGMSFSLPASPPDYATAANSIIRTEVEIFFTRNGNREGGWNLHEELDETKDLGVDGLDGLFDLYGAVGVYGEAEFNVKFRREEWLWRPRRSN